MRLSFIELIALIFTALAGVAASVQAFVSWNTRDEVARAIVFSERLEACADMMAAVNFVTFRSTPEARERLSNGPAANLYFTEFFLGYEAVRAGADASAVFRPLEARFQSAAAAYKIVMPEDLAPTIAFFERVVQIDVMNGGTLPKPEFLKYLEKVDDNAEILISACRELA